MNAPVPGSAYPNALAGVARRSGKRSSKVFAITGSEADSRAVCARMLFHRRHQGNNAIAQAAEHQGLADRSDICRQHGKPATGSSLPQARRSRMSATRDITSRQIVPLGADFTRAEPIRSTGPVRPGRASILCLFLGNALTGDTDGDSLALPYEDRIDELVLLDIP